MSSTAERVEIYSGIKRRRRCSVDEQRRIVQEASWRGITISNVSRHYRISPSLCLTGDGAWPRVRRKRSRSSPRRSGYHVSLEPSDGPPAVLKLTCWSGESVRVVFALNTCDREVIPWVATIEGINWERSKRSGGHSTAEGPREFSLV